MDERCASDLSPAQEFFIALYTSQVGGDVAIKSIQLLFLETLRWCDTHTEPNSWQRRRMYALLGPMYLEVMGEAIREMTGEATPRPAELLYARSAWSDVGPLIESTLYLQLGSPLQCELERALYETTALLCEITELDPKRAFHWRLERGSDEILE